MTTSCIHRVLNKSDHHVMAVTKIYDFQDSFTSGKTVIFQIKLIYHCTLRMLYCATSVYLCVVCILCSFCVFLNRTDGTNGKEWNTWDVVLCCCHHEKVIARVLVGSPSCTNSGCRLSDQTNRLSRRVQLLSSTSTMPFTITGTQSESRYSFYHRTDVDCRQMQKLLN